MTVSTQHARIGARHRIANVNPSSLPVDTSCEVYRLQIAIWRAMTPAERAQIADQLSVDVTEMARAGIRMQHPDFTPKQVTAELVRRRYGRKLAEAAFGPLPHGN